jgi:squalene synthase HpnC
MSETLDVAGAATALSRTHKDENFPVASALIAPRHRATILAYYRFARASDDIADNGQLSPDEKISRLDLFEATLLGRTDEAADALPLRAALAERQMAPRHALDLLRAFRLDAVKTRYANWDELMDYCAYSAAPVGRFVLEVHGESESTWPASDALCSALQIINHLQDCALDYRNLDRVYIPLDHFKRHGIDLTALTAPQASAGLQACIKELALETAPLISLGAELFPQVHDLRLRLETAVIARLAKVLNDGLLTRDPLSEETHLSKPAMLGWTLVGAMEGLLGRFRQNHPTSPRTEDA